MDARSRTFIAFNKISDQCGVGGLGVLMNVKDAYCLVLSNIVRLWKEKNLEVQQEDATAPGKRALSVLAYKEAERQQAELVCDTAILDLKSLIFQSGRRPYHEV